MTIVGPVLLLAVLFVPETQGPPVPATSSRRAKPSATAHSFDELSHAAEKARSEGRDKEAIDLYRQGLKLKPRWEEGLWYAGTLLYDQERYGDARDVLRHFVALRSDAGPGWALLGMSEFQTREYARALDDLRHGASLGLGGRKEMAQSVFYFVAVLLTRSERYDESMDLIAQMATAGQSEALLIVPTGLAALRVPLLPSEVPADRKDLVSSAGKAALAVQAQHQEEADGLLKQMVGTYPHEPGVHFFYGAFLMNVRPQDGIRELKLELEVSPFHVPARLRLADHYLKEQQLDQAHALAAEALKLDPGRASAHMVMGEVLLAQGDSGGGIRELELARNAAPEMVNIRWDLLRAYTAAGRAEDAKREKEEIERLSHPPARQ